jgi:hypothetical protein
MLFHFLNQNMMNISTYRSGKIKWIITAALVAVHSLLLFQDVTLNRVLCFKQDGAIDLEFACFDFRCICQDERSNCLHARESTDQKRRPYRLLPDCRHCLDVPVDGAYLERIVTSHIFDFIFSEQGAAEAETGAGYISVVCTVHHLLPPIRHLPHSILSHHFPILRC